MSAPATRGRIKIEDSAKRVRAYVGGELVADTKTPRLVWERPYYPRYYVAAQDVRSELLIPTGEVHHSPSRGDAELNTIKAGGKEMVDGARWYKESNIDELAGYITFEWGAIDAWFEDDEQVYVHPRDPYTRIDVLPSSRRVEVLIDGIKVADTTNARFLFETGLPTRYYIPKVDVRQDLLVGSDRHTDCPYKGTASHYHVDIEGNRTENIVWWYPSPVEESARIAGYLSFYNERVDIVLDGAPQERPTTVFS